MLVVAAVVEGVVLMGIAASTSWFLFNNWKDKTYLEVDSTYSNSY